MGLCYGSEYLQINMNTIPHHRIWTAVCICTRVNLAQLHMQRMNAANRAGKAANAKTSKYIGANG
jgi:hypothetical protein